MKATTDAASLHSLADWAQRIVPARPYAPILAAVLLDVTADGITATVTDYDVWGRADLSATADTATQIAVSARLLAGVADAAASAGNSRVEMIADGDGKLRISTRSMKASLPLMPAEDFPAWPAGADPDHLRPVDGPSLARVLDSAAGLAHHAESLSRESVAQVRLESSPDSLRVVATDSYRLHIADLPWSEPADFRYHGVAHLSPVGTRQIAATVKGAERVLLGFPEQAGNTITVGVPGRRLVARLTDGGGYPAKYEGLAPKAGAVLTVDRADLAALVKRVSTLAAVQGDKARHLDATVSAGTLTLTAAGDDGASLTDGLDVECSDDWASDWVIRLNAGFLAESVAAVPAKRLTFTVPGPAKAVLIRPADGETPDYPTKAVLMTIRLK
jgi:DNA polymerase III sliding clamp (beta) subunit (PCNA family)